MTLRKIGVFSLITALFAVFSIVNSSTVDETSTADSAKKIGLELEKVLNKVTNYKKLQEKYDPTKIDFEIKQRNGKEMVKDMKTRLEIILQKKIQSIKSLADVAQELMKNYTWNKELTLEQLESKTFIDSKFIETTGNITLKEEVSFSSSIKVNLNYSTVHVPTDVFKGSQVIVNSAKWTKDLDETFIKNREREPTLLWQYFGTSTGIYRSYPGYKWRKDNSKDFYDHRSRGWYIQGSSSPKNMVILLDLSGSMVGNKLAISKLSASFLLETLQENDFVNIVTFNNISRMLCDVSEVKKEFKDANCSKDLMQATKQNILYLKDMVNLVKARESANVSSGFKLAMEVLQFAQESKNLSGTGCIQTINFFTDGVENNEYEKTLEILEKQKAKEKKIRIFGYLVGREKGSPFLPIREIACKYRGYFYTIETLSAVRENVTSYLSVMGRPQGLLAGSDRPVSWTPIYLDNGGLGLMITVVAPVYDPNKQDKLLGVVGTDVALPELKSSIPEAKVGVNGYGFAVNNNGFIVIHPTLKDDSDVDESEDNRENPPHVTLEDLNLEDSQSGLENLSHSLIDRKSGKMTLKMRVLSKNKKRVTAERTYNFFYTEINGTSFSNAIAMTDLGLNYFVVKDLFDKDKEFKEALESLKTGNITAALSPWDICPGIVPARRASTPLYKPVYADAKDMLSNLTHGNYKTLCNEVELNQLLFGAYTTRDLGWNLQFNDTNGYLSVFVGTNGGLSRVLSPGGDSPIDNDVTNEPFYQRASEFEQNTVIISTAHKDKGSSSKADNVITASTPIYGTKSGDKVLAAVVGMQMKDDTLQEILLNNTDACTKESDADYTCYLLDEDGYVVASSSLDAKTEVGKHFEAVHFPAFNKMVTDNLYQVFLYKDNNLKCPEGFGVQESSAMRLLNPLLAVSSYVTWMTQTLFWSLVQFNIFSFFSSKSQVIAATTIKSDQTYCTGDKKFYKASPMNRVYSKKASCKEECLGELIVSNITGSNLRMVVIKNCGCEKKQKAAWQKKLEVESSFTPPSTRYRQLPQLKCYAFSEKESRDCGSGSILSPIKLLIIGLPLVYLLMAH